MDRDVATLNANILEKQGDLQSLTNEITDKKSVKSGYDKDIERLKRELAEIRQRIETSKREVEAANKLN